MSANIERNNELYPAVAAGNKAACEAMILNNLGLVVVKADALIRQMPTVAYLRDDLVSAGNIGLVEAVKQIGVRRVRMESVNLWLGRSIHREMRKLLPHERTIHVPRQSSDLARHNGCPIQPLAVCNVIPETLEANSDLRLVELRDVMDACCNTDTERECLRLREEGHTFPEISKTLNLPKSTIHDTFERVKSRVLAYWNEP